MEGRREHWMEGLRSHRYASKIPAEPLPLPEPLPPMRLALFTRAVPSHAVTAGMGSGRTATGHFCVISAPPPSSTADVAAALRVASSPEVVCIHRIPRATALAAAPAGSTVSDPKLGPTSGANVTAIAIPAPAAASDSVSSISHCSTACHILAHDAVGEYLACTTLLKRMALNMSPG
jgi:hypothetical protein